METLKTLFIILGILIALFIMVKWFLASSKPSNEEHNENGGGALPSEPKGNEHQSN